MNDFPTFCTNRKRGNFVAFKGVKFWNDLDISIRETKPKHKFIKKFKKLVFESYQ